VGGRLGARIGAQGSDGIEQLEAMPKCGDAELLQLLVRQARKNRLVYLILAECSLVFPKAKAPQPNHNVHEGAHIKGRRTSSSRPERVSRRGLGYWGLLNKWTSQGFARRVGIKREPRVYSVLLKSGGGAQVPEIAAGRAPQAFPVAPGDQSGVGGDRELLSGIVVSDSVSSSKAIGAIFAELQAKGLIGGGSS
jgi:hypothetical protein